MDTAKQFEAEPSPEKPQNVPQPMAQAPVEYEQDPQMYGADEQYVDQYG